MIIGIDASRANDKSRTGTEWYSFILIKKFSELDKKNEYRLYTASSSNKELFNLGNNFKLKTLNWPIKRLWHQGRLSLEMLFNKPDILFVPAHTIPLIHPLKTITTCHDIGFERWPELYSALELKYHRFSMRLAVKKANKIITISQFSKQEIMDVYKVKVDKIKVIHLGVDHDFFQKQPSDKINHILEKLEIKKPYLLFVGRLEKKKNIINQIKAFNLLKEKYQIPHQLVLAGNFGFGKEEIEKEINNSQFKNDIKLLGYTKADYLPSLYSGADILWFITNYEGFGLPVLEAQACQTPVIASNICSLPEIGGRGVMLVKPDDIEQIAQVSYNILSDNETREGLIQNGLENIKRFDWNKCARETLDVLTI